MGIRAPAPPPPRDRGSADPPGAHKFRNFGSARTGLDGRPAGRKPRRSSPPLPRQGGGLGDPPPDFTATRMPREAIRIARRPSPSRRIGPGNPRPMEAPYPPLKAPYLPLSGPKGTLSARPAARKAPSHASHTAAAGGRGCHLLPLFGPTTMGPAPCARVQITKSRVRINLRRQHQRTRFDLIHFTPMGCTPTRRIETVRPARDDPAPTAEARHRFGAKSGARHSF